MIIWLLLLILSIGAGLAVNFLCDYLIGLRYVEVDPDGTDKVDPADLLCEACVRRKAISEYFWAPPRCSKCGKLRWRVLLVHLFISGLTFWLWFSQPALADFLAGMLLLAFFGVVIVIDVEHRLILHPVSLAGAILGLAFGIWQHGFKDTLVGGVAGFAIMLGLFLLGALFAHLIARLRGQTLEEVALGFGDVNLAGVLGLMLGWPGIIGGLFLAVFLGGLFSLLYLLIKLALRKYRVFAAIPYGPFLIMSAMFLLFFRDVLLAVLP